MLPAQEIEADVSLAEYGLDSVYAFALCGEIEDTMGIPIEPTLLWDVDTLRALTAHLADRANRGPEVPLVSTHGPRRLVPAQLAIWRARELAPDTRVYQVGGYIEIEGRCDADLLRTALRRALDEAENARLRFGVRVGTPWQRVVDPGDYPIESVDLRAAADPRAAAVDHMIADFNRPADLSAGHRIFLLDGGRIIRCQRAHHIVCDGGSLGFFADRVAGICSALAAARDPEPGALPPLSVQLDAADAYELSADRARDRDHWRSALAGLPAELVASADRPRPRPRPSHLVRHVHDFSAAEAGRLRVGARRLRTTVARPPSPRRRSTSTGSPIEELFATPTTAELAARLERNTERAEPARPVLRWTHEKETIA